MSDTAPLASESRLAVVTGASSGIGAATARELAAAGFHVFCAARRTDRIEKLASDIGGTAVACDVTDEASVAALTEVVGPRLDVLVNNAGGAFGTESVAEARVEDWQAMFDVNVIGTLNVTKALLPALVASGDGVLINMGSTAGRVAYEGGGGYTAAKHGVAVMTETLRLELVGQPVRICEIAPGTRIDRVAGMTKAAPTPISARVAISWLALWANVESNEAMPTVARPSCSAPLRPKRSPSAPDGSSRKTNTIA